MPCGVETQEATSHMRKQPLPYDIQIPEPCPADWNTMQPGSGVSRHCESCNRAVHDLSRLTPREVRRLVGQTNGSFCARVTHHADGTLLLRDPVSPSQPIAAGLLLAAALASGAATSAAAQAHTSAATIHAAASSPADPIAQTATVGKVEVPDHPPTVLGGMILPPKPITLLQGKVLLPGNAAVVGGTLLFVTPRGKQQEIAVNPDGTYLAVIAPGKYVVHATVWGKDRPTWAGTQEITLREGEQTRDFHPGEPVTVTAGVPAVMLAPGSGRKASGR